MKTGIVKNKDVGQVGQFDQPDVVPDKVLEGGSEDKIVTVEGEESQDVQPSETDTVLSKEIGRESGQKIVPGHGPRAVGGPKTLKEAWRFMSTDIRERSKLQRGGGSGKPPRSESSPHLEQPPGGLVVVTPPPPNVS